MTRVVRRLGRNLRGALLATALCVASVTLALVLVEVGLRLAGLGDAVQYDYPADLGWVNRPRQHARTVGGWTVRINGAGLRGPEVGPKGDRTFRILLVGDSFTFGYGVPEAVTYGAQLQRLLDARGGSCGEVQILNGGVNGYNTAQAVALVDRKAESLRPDLVVLGFNPNDIMAPAEARTMLQHPALKRWLGRSATYHVLAPRLKAILQRGAGQTYNRTIERFIAGDTAVAPRAEAVGRSVMDLLALGRRHSFSVAVALFPFADQVLGPPNPRWPPEVFRRIATAEAVPVLDLLPAFRAAAAAGQTLFLDEPTHHPNAAGLRLVAKELAGALQVNGLLPHCQLAPSTAASVSRR